MAASGTWIYHIRYEIKIVYSPLEIVLLCMGALRKAVSTYKNRLICEFNICRYSESCVLLTFFFIGLDWFESDCIRYVAIRWYLQPPVWARHMYLFYLINRYNVASVTIDTMLHAVFGKETTSSCACFSYSIQKPECHQLNGKELNWE